MLTDNEINDILEIVPHNLMNKLGKPYITSILYSNHPVQEIINRQEARQIKIYPKNYYNTDYEWSNNIRYNKISKSIHDWLNQVIINYLWEKYCNDN